MRSLGIVFTLLFGMSFSFSQHYLPMLIDTNGFTGQQLTVLGIADVSSNALTNSLVNKFAFGGDIDQTMKDAALEKHQSINRFGADLNAEIEYRNFNATVFKQERLGWLVKAGAYTQWEAFYNRNLFRLAMYGNSLFGEDTIQLGGTRFQSTGFQKIGFGICDKKTGSALTLNLVGLTNRNAFELSTLNMASVSDGDSIKFKYDMTGAFNNSGAYFKGFGLAIDFDFRFTTNNEVGDKMLFQALGRNLGFALPTVNATRYDGMGYYSFSGYPLSDLTSGSLVFDNVQQWMDTLNVTEENERKLVLLPGFLQIAKIVNTSSTKKLQSFFGAQLYLSKIAIPKFFVGLDYQFVPKMHLGASASFGGYSWLKGGAYLSYTSKNWSIGASAENLFNKTGFAYLIRLQCAF